LTFSWSPLEKLDVDKWDPRQAKPRSTGEHKTSKRGTTQGRKGRAASPQEGAAEREARTQQAMSQTLPKGSSGEDVLGTVVGQLARCRLDELARLKGWTGLKKQLAVYRCGNPPSNSTASFSDRQK